MESKKAIWECLDQFSGNRILEKLARQKMTEKDWEDYYCELEFRADCDKDDKMMKEFDDITERELEGK